MENSKLIGSFLKKTILSFVIVLPSYFAHSQILNQDASGKSSIVWQGSSITIDITESLIKINHYDEFRDSLFYGFDLQAENESGVANLFEKNNFTPNAEFSLLYGKKKVIVNIKKIKRAAEIKSQLPLKKLSLDTVYKKLVDETIIGCNKQNPQNIKDLKKKLLSLNKKGWYNIYTNVLNTIPAIEEKDEKCKAILIDQVIKLSTLVKEEVTINEYVILKKELAGIGDSSKDYVENKTVLWYARISGNAIEFKYDKMNDASIVNDRFTDKLDIGALGEYGVSYQWQMNYLGINLGYAYTSNFSNLKSEDYSYSSQDTTVTTGSLTQSESFKAYSGEFDNYSRLFLKIDYLKMVDLGQSHYLLFGPYFRQNVSLNEDLAKHNTVLGIGMNYINGKSGKFLGGIYFQTRGLAGVTEKNLTKSISFGITVRINLSRIQLPN